MSAMTEGVSFRAFAKLDGCSEGLVRRGVRQGRLVPGPDGRLDPALAKTGWRKGNADGARTGTQTGPGYGASLARKEHFLAELRQLELRHKTGELVEARAVQKTAFDSWRRARDVILGLPPQLAPELAVMTDAFQVEQRLQQALRGALSDLAKMAQADLDFALTPRPSGAGH